MISNDVQRVDEPKQADAQDAGSRRNRDSLDSVVVQPHQGSYADRDGHHRSELVGSYADSDGTLRGGLERGSYADTDGTRRRTSTPGAYTDTDPGGEPRTVASRIWRS